MRLTFLQLLTSGLLAAAPNTFTAPVPTSAGQPRGRAEILWDTWGVPHLFARDLEALGFAFGWAQMEAHGDLLLRLYGEARGRSAEYWGGQENLERDRLIHTFGVPELARDWTRRQPAEFGRFLRAFTAGLNAYASEHGDALDPAARRVLPLEPQDVLAHCLRVNHFTFVAQMEAMPGMTRAWERRPGSNAWAVAPKRSASGHALLLANPHLPWSGLFLWFEAHWHTPKLDGYGATLVGLPVLGIAFNQHLGWTHTVNAHDGCDVYELTLRDNGYLLDGTVQPFVTTAKTLKMRQPDGSLREERLSIRRSIHGPVIAEKPGRALAVRVVGLDAPGLGQQYLDMIRATNLRRFERVLTRLDIPMFTILYADADGHILHLFGGRTPIRPEGPWNWASIVPGDTRATLWTRTLPYERLPRVADPASGWLQNANDPPWTTTFPAAIDRAQYPAYVAPQGMGLRPQRSARLLMANDHFTFDEFVAAKFDTRVELADRLLDDVFAAVEQQDSAKAREAAAVLRAWDRRVDAESRGAELFRVFVSELMKKSQGRIPFATAWDERRPLDTPNGLADAAAAVAALEAAVDQMRAQQRPLDVAWGQVCRLRQGALDLPASGSQDPFGVFRNFWFRPTDDGRLVAMGGDSFVCAVEFSHPVRARAVLSYGNASQPGARHNGDQLELVARKELRPVWLTRPDIEAHLERRERL